jgi:hypothetical protein
MQSQTDNVRSGDIVVTPGNKLGIVVGIYGLGYCEVLINRGTNRAQVVPYRQSDLKRFEQASTE